MKTPHVLSAMASSGRIDTRSLRYCEAVASLGSFTRAAEALNVAQPAVSAAIKKLEEDLGVSLFVRHARKVIPTPEGELLLKRIERIFAEMDSARRELSDVVSLRMGEVRIGLPPMYGTQYFPKLVTAFHAQYPGVSISALHSSAGGIGSLLDNGEIDLAVMEARRLRPGWASVPVGEDEMVLCVRPEHPLSAHRSIPAKLLDGLPMVVFTEAFLQRNVLDERCRQANVKYSVVLQSNFVPFLQQAAEDGLGVATLLRSQVMTTSSLVPLSLTPPEIFSFHLCWHSDRYLSRANRAFVDLASGRLSPKAEGRNP